MTGLLDKTPRLEKDILPDVKSVKSLENRPDLGVEKKRELGEFDEAELERLRQEVLEEVDMSENLSKKPTLLPAKPVATNNSKKSPILLNIEAVMEDGLDDIFLKMESQLQMKFKEEGEKTAVEISRIIESGKIEGRKIFKLMLKWLKIIPGVNKFFLRQEAKIKTDKMININH